MLRSVRNYFFEEEAKAGKSDVAVLVIVAAALVYAGHALHTMGWFQLVFEQIKNR